ncbi:acyl-CoA dehydrogenase family protein [Reyranella sp. CPCC 100927]|uniref:acyl-CoA dehydrogenase family protein n=1 Tax=Reyranella sp. CPCC 100927 TaxID=2599616 RepID=UPI0011B6E926|nr:acyl-CoA dehydrogenase family protein [Reyranella sp. CPCC 100927]TWT00255.1 acyl-CoA dehydrogenase [Reyranella sp. CPCC 100927]
MSTDTMLTDTLARLLTAKSGPADVQAAERAEGWNRGLWHELAALGLTDIGNFDPDQALADQLAILYQLGRHAATVPFLETVMIGQWLAQHVGLPAADGVLMVSTSPSIGMTAVRAGASWLLSGRTDKVPFARIGDRLLIVATGADGPVIAPVGAADCTLVPSVNMAGEPRDTVQLDGVPVPAADVHRLPDTASQEVLWERGALGRAAMMAGALQSALDLSVQYAKDRKQFGRPIGAFQAVQQNLAILAAEVTATRAMVTLAGRIQGGAHQRAAVASAKARAGRAAGIASRLAHQIHGAMGFTDEYPLQLFTRRLWSWRDEFGSDRDWMVVLGGLAARQGPGGLWPMITAAGDRTRDVA